MPLPFQQTIAHKRDGSKLTREEIVDFIERYTADDLPDYQASALLMAIYLRGLDSEETADLTVAMADSGGRLDLSALEAVRPTVDKHSTGGVGDKASLVVVPILAASGAAVCKMSGRGLGHTGGTLDKLEAIPGFRIELSANEMISQVRTVGACIAGQTADLAPADKKLYALRDVTATVGSIPLIVGSILSKKIAGGARRFLFDVKVGSGALMKELDEARLLARYLVDGATTAGRTAVAVLTDMDQPLGRAIGNSLEVAEAIEMLTPTTPGVDPRFREVCLHLAGEGLLLCGLAEDAASARALAERQVTSGAALRVFRDMVAAQCGDVACVDDPARLPRAAFVRDVPAPAPGWVSSIDAAALGMAVVGLGGGRARKSDAIDYGVGLVVRAPVGTRIETADTLVTIHARNAEDADRAEAEVLAAFRIGPELVDEKELIRGRISA